MHNKLATRHGWHPWRAHLMGVGLVTLIGLAGCASVPQDTAVAVQAQVEQVSGRVLLVRDNVYFEAEPGMDLQPGDRLLSLANASATVQYHQVDAADEVIGELCQVRLEASKEWLVQGREDCD